METPIGQIIAGSRLRTGILLVLCGVALIACGNSAHFEGKWVGKVTVEGKPGADPDILRTMGKVDLEILPNGRFNIFVDGLSRQGTLEYAANSATLHYEQVMGRPSKDAGSATVQQVDSENLKFEDESKSLVLKRMQPPGGSGRIP